MPYTAALVAEVARLRQSVARLEGIERAAVAILDYEVNSTDHHIDWERYYSDLRKAVLAAKQELG
jgi:hypothetical protein